MTRPEAPWRLVVVEWEDSQRPLGTWLWLDEYDLPDVVRCWSVGWLVAENKSAVAIAPNLGDLAYERIQAAGIIRIPRSAIRSMKTLRGDRDGRPKPRKRHRS